MKGIAILSLALLVTFVSASPLTLEKDDKPMRVVDVPAGIFETPVDVEDNKPVQEEVVAKETKPEVITIDSINKDVEKVDDKKEPLGGEGSVSAEEGPNVFGIRFPSILIIRRPPMFQDPFAGFQSPFFGGFNRRPIFSPPFVNSEPDRVNAKDQTVAGSDSKVDEKKVNETVLMTNVIQRMHQQFNNLFSNLFNPEGFQRPAYPQFTPSRPFFSSRPSIFSPIIPDASSEEDNVDFGKLPDNYSNSTSETKLIDGQLVTVNRTIHKISGNNSNGIFHFSVINYRPSAPEIVPETEKVVPIVVEAKPESTDTKPVVIGAEADPSMNEVDRVDNAKLPEVELKSTYEINANDEPINNGQEIDFVQIIPIKSEKLIRAPSDGKTSGIVNDLSSDIRVNNLMENSQQARVRALFNPDEVEVFEV